MADFNGDGFPDLATTSSFTDTTSILLGDGLGSFRRALTHPVGGLDSVAGDFNGDGLADLALSVSEGVSILRGDGRGGFELERELCPLPRSVESLAVGDFNGDGVLDLAAQTLPPTIFGPFSVSILQRDALEECEVKEIPVDHWPGAFAVGYLNGDDALDLAVAYPFESMVGILLGDGAGDFQMVPDALPVDQLTRSIAVGDINNDGKADLATANDDTVSILLGNGMGGFHVLAPIPVGDGSTFVTMGDLNDDGAVDLAIANARDSTVSILLGDGTGSFLDRADFRAGKLPYAIALADYNGDAAPDLAVLLLGDKTVSILLGDGLGGFLQEPTLGAGDAPNAVALGEFNGDGIADLAVANFGGTVNILLGDDLGGFVPAPDIDVGDGAGSGGSEAGAFREPGSLAVGQFNDDDWSDLAVPNREDGTVSILLGDGPGSFRRERDLDVGPGHHSVAVGDFNDDGHEDLAVSNAGDDTVSILLGDGSGEFGPPENLPVGSGPLFVAVGDFDEDGVADLAVATGASTSFDGTDDAVSVFRGTGTGGFAPLGEIPMAAGPRFITISDLDGDGHADLAVGSYGCPGSCRGFVSVFRGDGLGGFTLAAEVGGQDAISLSVADFNNDGLADLAAASPGSGRVTILVGDGLGGFVQRAGIGVGIDPWSVAAGEFNGDGAPDLVVLNRGSNTVSLLFNQLSDRADVNGSNRIDGFDIAAIGRRYTASSTDPDYRRTVDVNLDGIIDGDDLAEVASIFGSLRKEASPLRPRLVDPVPAAPDTITLQQVATEGDLLTVEVLVNDDDDPAAVAEFTVTFAPTDGILGQVLEYAGRESRGYLSGALAQFISVDSGTPGKVVVNATRFPLEDRIGTGEEALLDLFFRAKREGDARLDFDPSSRLAFVQGCPIGCEVPGVSFVGGVAVRVDASGGGPPGQRIALFPQPLNFGSVPVGASSRRALRISNFGFSELEVENISATPGFTSFFREPFSVAPFGFVELSVEFSPAGEAQFFGNLLVKSNDPRSPHEVLLQGRGGS